MEFRAGVHLILGRRVGAALGGADPASAIGWAVAAVMLVLGGAITWSFSLDLAGANIVGPGLILLGVSMAWSSLNNEAGLGGRGQAVVLFGLAVVLAYRALSAFYADPSYGTDSAAFDQYAAQLLIHGQNPYTSSMAPALSLFHVPSFFQTYRLDGIPVLSLSYPAGSFIPYLAPVALGFQTQTANAVDLLAWLIAVLLLWRLLPRSLRWVAAILLGLTTFNDFIIGGGTDALWVPALIIALWRWDQYGLKAETSAARWLGPFALGVAVSIKQTPWLVLPFILVGLGIEARGRGERSLRVVMRYAIRVAGVFTAVNLPFVLWSPARWLHSILVPFTQPLIPDGQGLVNLTLTGRLGGGLLVMYSLAAATLLVALLMAYAAQPSLFKRSWPLLISVVFFLPVRSFTTYMIMLVPAALVAATTVGPAPASTSRRRRFGLAALAVGGLAVGFGAIAVAIPGPLRIHVINYRSTGQLQTINEVTVSVTDPTGRPMHPHFSAYFAGHTHSFWYGWDGQRQIDTSVPPHASRTFVLRAPDVQSMIPLRSGFVIEAFTEGPAAVSTAEVSRQQPMSVVLHPASVGTPVAVGRVVTLVAQLSDRLERPVLQAGVQVELGQVVYEQTGLLPGEASINGNVEGRSPVGALTDSQGRAHFRVVAVQSQQYPTFFQAWLAPAGGAPHGYSDQLSIQFVG